MSSFWYGPRQARSLGGKGLPAINLHLVNVRFCELNIVFIDILVLLIEVHELVRFKLVQRVLNLRKVSRDPTCLNSLGRNALLLVEPELIHCRCKFFLRKDRSARQRHPCPVSKRYKVLCWVFAVCRYVKPLQSKVTTGVHELVLGVLGHQDIVRVVVFNLCVGVAQYRVRNFVPVFELIFLLRVNRTSNSL